MRMPTAAGLRPSGPGRLPATTQPNQFFPTQFLIKYTTQQPHTHINMAKSSIDFIGGRFFAVRNFPYTSHCFCANARNFCVFFVHFCLGPNEIGIGASKRQRKNTRWLKGFSNSFVFSHANNRRSCSASLPDFPRPAPAQMVLRPFTAAS